MEDINTERRGTDEQLDKLSEMIPVGIIRRDTAGNCVYANERWCQLTGLTREEACGVGWIRALHPEDRERVLKGWRKAASEAKEFADEFRFQAPDGHMRAVSCRAAPLLDNTGELTGYMGAITDVTERQQTEEALREVAHEHRQRVKELNCLFGISHIVEHSGSSLRHILQETAKLLPASWEHSDIACARVAIGDLEFKSDNYVDTAWKQQADITVHGEAVGTVEVCYLEEMPIRDHGPFLAEETNLLAAVAERLGRVTEHLRTKKLLADREQELRDRLTHTARVSLMGEMASSIAHEVNQPLTAVATYAQAGRRMVDAGMADSGLVTDVLERISAEALRAGDIIHRLKKLVQKREGKRVPSDINKLIRDIERLASVDARMHEVRLSLDLASPLPPALVDEIQIQQVILNLMRNGIDAMENVEPAHRKLIVRTKALGNAIQISVTDHGCGLPEDAERTLFQPFFTTKKGGMGMGLSISRSIVDSHGGHITFEPNADGGATFSFTLPFAREDHHDKQ